MKLPSVRAGDEALELWRRLFETMGIKRPEDLTQYDEYDKCYFCGVESIRFGGKHKEDCIGVAALRLLETLK